MKIFENIINHKISSITAEELLKYANQFQISISNQHASPNCSIFKWKKCKYFQYVERAKLN